MKESAKAKRIKQHQRRGKIQGKLNLVSLMDIFTILVFFLMVNSSSDVQVLNQDNKIKLPVSSADQTPKEALALTVTDQIATFQQQGAANHSVASETSEPLNEEVIVAPRVR